MKKSRANQLKTKAKPPGTLSADARFWWKHLVEEFCIDDHAGFLLLDTAMRSFDHMKLAEAILARDGLTIADRFGVQKQHPATLVLRDSRNLMLRSLKALNLDIQPGAPLGKGGH